jgi:hypothetical protein
MRRAGVLLISVMLFVACSSDENVAVPLEERCLGSELEFDVTTSKGSAEVRRQVNRLYMDVWCTLLDLRSAIDGELEQAAVDLVKAKRVGAQKRSRYLACLNRIGIKEDDWLPRYLSVDNPPCGTEYSADWEANKKMNELKYVDPRPRDEYEAWVAAIEKAAAFARVYPDSIQPQHLTTIMDLGDKVDGCLANGSWCYDDGKE